MSDMVYPGPLGEMRTATVDGRGASYTAGGHSLSTAIKNIQLPPGTKYLQLLSRNFSTAVVVRFALNPYLIVLKTTDLLAAAANTTDGSNTVQDASTSTALTLSSLDTLANTDALYIGSSLPFGGVSVDVGNTNSTPSVLAVTYWAGSSFTNITPTDGTTSGGATLAQDGNVTWTVPSDWVPAALRTIVATCGTGIPYSSDTIYWTRWALSAALDSSVTVRSMLALTRSTDYAELTPSDSFAESIYTGPGGVGNVEALTDAGTANLIVNVGAGMGLRFP